MLVTEKIGNLNFFALNNRKIDYLMLEWFETNKRILHKKTVSGIEVKMKFLSESPDLTENDVIYEDDFNVIVVDIIECDVIVVIPKTMHEMASVCYEIGNKHIPVFYQQDEILVAYEEPLFQLLAASGYDVSRDNRKLINPLKTTVSSHGYIGKGTLFSKIMKFTNPSNE